MKIAFITLLATFTSAFPLALGLQFFRPDASNLEAYTAALNLSTGVLLLSAWIRLRDSK
jgi:hypothetical protein